MNKLTLVLLIISLFILKIQLSNAAQLVIGFDAADPAFPTACGDSWSEDGINLQIENYSNPAYCNFSFNGLLTISSAQLLLDFSNLGTINKIEADVIASCGDLLNQQFNSNSSNKTYQKQNFCMHLEIFAGVDIVSTINCNSNYIAETLVFENTNNSPIDNMKLKSYGGEILQIRIDYSTNQPSSFTANVPTNYSGIVNLTLNNNQNILENNSTKIKDYATCNEISNSNCNPLTGFNNLAANEVLWATEKAYSYFLEKHNFDLPHITSYINRDYNGNPNQASYNKIKKEVYYGAGDGLERNSMTSPDIIGHEITHYLIDSISQLGNYGEFGALQESFADIFGEMIEFYCYGINDWIFGSQVITANANYDGIRNLANPTDLNMKNPQPAFYKSENYWIVQNESCYFDDLCGIHINSGVQNYWFYLLSEGGSSINENGDFYNIAGIGKEKAAQITFENLKNISTNTEAITPHYQAMYGAIQAAQNLFGENSNEVLQTRNAWRAVGLYEAQTNPIKWRIANQQLNGQIIESGDTTMIPMRFDLIIDSLDQELTADKLSINLQLPNEMMLDSVTALLPLLQTELTVQQGAGETNILVNRQGNQAAKTLMAPRIKSGSPIFTIVICIATVDIAGENSNFQIGISGGTESNTFVQFQPDELALGVDNNNLNAATNFLLNVAIGLNQKSCSALGWLDVAILNGDPPFDYTLKNSMDIILEQTIKNDTCHQFLNLDLGNYQLNIKEVNGQRDIIKNFNISHYANIDGSQCCAENLIITAGEFNGLFNAQQNIEIKQGASISSGNFSICND